MPLSLEIITPEGVAWSGKDIDSVVMPARDGEIEILPGHIPLITMLNAGRIGIKKGADEEDLAIDKGYARCMGDVVSVLTEAAIEVENIDYAAAEDAKNEALKAIEQAKLNRNLDEIEIEKLEAIARFSIAQLLAKGKK